MKHDLKLHLGCGSRHIPGFVHIDAVHWPHVDIVSNVDRLPLDDGVASMIYASHFLEHFDRRQYLEVLDEWYRVLAPGGLIRVSVPDFAACVAEYHLSGIADGLTGLVGLVMGGQRDAYDFHKMIFDERSLTEALRGAGFSVVRRWDWRNTEHCSVDDYSQAYLPHLAKNDGRLMSLNLEAVKP